MNKKFFITGSNGFIGQYLVNYLSQKGYIVYALLRDSSVPGFNLNKNVVCVTGDLLDKTSLVKGIPQNCIVINLAANPYHPELSYRVNVEGTRNLIEACKKNKISRIVHISSQATKIKNKGVYADTKNKSDDIIKSSGLSYVILKPSLVYGGGEKGLFNKIRGLVSKVPLVPIFGNGKTKVNPIYVEDLCEFIELVAFNFKDKGNVYDVGSLKPITYNDLYKGMVTNIEKKIYFLHIPVLIGLIFGKLFRLLKFKNPPFFIDNVLGSTQETNCDPKNIIKTYNYYPRDFKSGLNEIYGSKKINVGVVGLGKMGLFHLSILSTFSDVNIVALVDTNKALFSTIKSMGIPGKFYDSVDMALENEKIDAFWILTPTFTHLPLIKSLIKNKINVFVEKPVVLNEKQVDELKSYSSNYPAIINVGYVWLFKRTYRKVREIIGSKKMGEILNFEISFKHGEVFGEKRGWMFSKDKSGGGVMMNPGPHVFSLVNLLFGTPKKVNGSIKSIYSTEVDDEADLELTYKGFFGKVFLSWSVKNANIAETLVNINFEKGFLSTDGKEINIVLKNGKKEKINEYDIDPILENSFNVNPDANGDSFYIEDRLFVDSIRTKNKDSINNLDFGLKTESIIFNCYREAK